MTSESESDNNENLRKAYERVRFYQDVLTHDMNNILNNINLSLILLSPKYRNEQIMANIDENLDIINYQLKKAAYLVSRIQKLSAIDNLKLDLKPINIYFILKNTIELVHKRFQNKKVKINLKDSEQDSELNFYVLANKLMKHLFEFILENAIEHNINEEIIIDIKISKLIKDNKEYVKIEFIDNGIGIPDDKKELVFIQGYFNKKNHEELGSGLSFAKRILKIINGQMWIENKIKDCYKKGSNFIILLPITKK